MANKLCEMYYSRISMCLFFLILKCTSARIAELLNAAEFPPILKKIPGEPLGHNKPFGYQRAPEGPVIEYKSALDANKYWLKHVKPHIPLVYRGYIKDSPAISLWNDDYLNETYGDLDVLVEHKVEDRTSTSGRMRLKDFLSHYKEDDMYVVSMFPSEMMHEVRAIPSVLCGTFRKFTHESNLWISNGGTRSVIHYDADHNVHCVLAGRKDFMMINNNLTTQTNLYFKAKSQDVGSGFSFLDPDSINMKKFKNIKKVPWTYATLYPGDCIYIPSVYIHQVRGYGRTIAVTTLFTADIQDNFNGDDCEPELLEKYYSMADIDFQWTYKKGDKTIDMGYMNVELVKNSIREGLHDPELQTNGKFTRKQFIYFAGTFSAYGRNQTLMNIIWRDVFNFSENYIFDESTIEKLSLDQWKEFCRAIEAPHGVVTNGTEPVFVRPGEEEKYEKYKTMNEDDFRTMEEKREKIILESDPMFKFLSDEEKVDYIEKRKQQKLKYGVDYNPDDVNVDDMPYIHWKLRDLPVDYRRSLENGIIPAEYRDDIINALPLEIREQYAEELSQNIFPEKLKNMMDDDTREQYNDMIKHKILEENRNKETEDVNKHDKNEDEDEEPEHFFPFEFDDIDDVDTQIDILDGRIDDGNIEPILKVLPKQLKPFEDVIRKGIIPQEVQAVILRVSEAEVADEVRRIKLKLGLIKEEL